MPNYNEVETKAEVAKTQAVAQPQDKPQVKSTVKSKPKKGLVERLVVGVIGPDGLPALGSSIKLNPSGKVDTGVEPISSVTKLKPSGNS